MIGQQSEISKRVVLIYRYLRDNKKIKNKDEFCSKIDIDRDDFRSVELGEAEFPEDRLHTFIHTFKVSVNYLFNGTGDMFIITAKFNRMPVQDPTITKFKYMTLEDDLIEMSFILN